MGAENPNEAQQRAVEQEVQGMQDKLKKRIETGTDFSGDVARIAELANALDGMKDALVATEKALDAVVFKDTEHRHRAEEKLRGEIGEALTALHGTMRASERDAATLLDATRDELTKLGVAAKEGPPKPSSWNPGGIFGSEARFDEWMRKLDRNPRELLAALAGVALEAADETRTAAPAAGPRQEATRDVSWGNQVIAYVSGGVTADRIKKYEEPSPPSSTDIGASH